MAELDLAIRGGTLVDGTGAPGRRGDLGIRDGKIAELGQLSGEAARELDASRLRGRARLRRHPHPLRRAGVLGPHAHDLAVARRDLGRDGQLRLRRRADPARAPRPDHAHARERRGHVARGAARGHRPGLAVRDLPAVPRRDRAPRHRDQRRRARRPHARAAVRDGRGGDRARGDRGRDRADGADRRRGAARRRGRLRDHAARRPTSATRAGRCRAAPPSMAEIERLAATLATAGRGVMQATIGRGFFTRRARRARARDGPLGVVDGAPRGRARSRRTPQACSSDHEKLQRAGRAGLSRRSPAGRSTSSSSGRRRSRSRACRSSSRSRRRITRARRSIYADPQFRAAFRERGQRGGIAGRWEDTVDLLVSARPEPRGAERRRARRRDAACTRSTSRSTWGSRPTSRRASASPS